MVLPRAPKPWTIKGHWAVWFVTFYCCYYLNFQEALSDPFLQPMCDPDGTCHEKPHVPMTRTVYSAKSQDEYVMWFATNRKLNVNAGNYIKRRAQIVDDKKLRSLVLLGDSITESWLGTNMGQEVERTGGIPRLFKDKFQNFDPIVLAIGGDQTQHLLYRISNGQLPSKHNKDAIFVVLIGTNNIGKGELPGPTAQGVLAVAEYVLEQTKVHLILFQVLPRGDSFRFEGICPPRCSSPGKPLKLIMPIVNELNGLIRKGVEDLKSRYGKSRLGLIDCGSEFLTSNGETHEVHQSLMPDLLHPNADGHAILADCILTYIMKLN